MYKLLCSVLLAAFSWQLVSSRYIAQPNYHSIQPYQPHPYQYPHYGYPYSGSPFYRPPPYQLAPYPFTPYSPPGTYFDYRAGVHRPFAGGGVPILLDYHKRCSNQFVGLKPHPEDRQYYYVCKHDSVIFGKCQNLQIFNATCGQCVQHPRPEYMPSCQSTGRFPIYSDCRIYYKCEHDLKPQIYTCPQNMTFSAASQECIKGNRCATTQIAYGVSILPEFCEGKFPPCYESGIFRSPLDCSLYYKCEMQSNEVFLQTRLRCPEGNFYDKQYKKCLPKHQVPCDCIQVAEMVYPKPNPLPYHTPVYPARFDIDSLEESSYPIEQSDEEIDDAGDTAEVEDIDAAAEENEDTEYTTASPIITTVTTESTEPIETTTEPKDETEILQDYIDINKEQIGDSRIEPDDLNDFIIQPQKIESASHTIEQEDKENDTTTEQNQKTTTIQDDRSTTTEDESTTSATETTTETNLSHTEDDLEGSGSDSENNGEGSGSSTEITTTESENETTTETMTNETDTDETTEANYTTTEVQEDSSTVSPTTMIAETTIPSTTASSTITSQATINSNTTSVAPKEEHEEVSLAPDTQIKDPKETLNNNTHTQEVPETSTTVKETITTTQTPTFTISQSSPEMETTTQTADTTTESSSTSTTTTAPITDVPTTLATPDSTTDLILEDDDDFGVLDSEIFIDDFKQASQKDEENFARNLLIAEEMLPVSATSTLTEQGTNQLISEETTLMPNDETTPTRITSTEAPITTTNSIDSTKTSTKASTTVSAESTTDFTLEEDNRFILDSEIVIDHFKLQENFDNNLLLTEDLIPINSILQENEISHIISDETTQMPEEDKTIDSEVTETTQASSLSTVLPTNSSTVTTTTERTSLEDELGILDSEIVIDNSEQESFDNNPLIADEMLPVTAEHKNVENSTKTSDSSQKEDLLNEEFLPVKNINTYLSDTTESFTDNPYQETTDFDFITESPLEEETNPYPSSTTPQTTTTEAFPTERPKYPSVTDEMLPITDEFQEVEKSNETSDSSQTEDLINEEFIPVKNIYVKPSYLSDTTESFTDNPYQETTDFDFITESPSSLEITTTTPQTTTEETLPTKRPKEYDSKANDNYHLVTDEIIPVTYVFKSEETTSETSDSYQTNNLIDEEFIPVNNIYVKPTYLSDTTESFTDNPYQEATDFDYVTESPLEEEEETTPYPTPLDITSTTKPQTTPAVEKVSTTMNDEGENNDDSTTELYPEDVSTTQASSAIPSTPDTSEITTQTSSTIDTYVENSTENPTTRSTTLSTTQTPTITPKYYASYTSPIPKSNNLVIKVREDDQPSPSSYNSPIYFTLNKKPVINNNNYNTNSYNQTVAKPPCDNVKNGEIPRLEIMVEHPIDVHFSICPSNCEKDHDHNYSSTSNRAVFLKWFPNNSKKTIGFETSSDIKTEGHS